MGGRGGGPCSIGGGSQKVLLRTFMILGARERSVESPFAHTDSGVFRRDALMRLAVGLVTCKWLHIGLTKQT